MRFSSCFTMLLLACGARTELGTGHGAPIATTCTEPAWVIFDHSGHISAIRSDGSSFHDVDLGVHAFLPSVSPDGKSMLVVTGNETASELVLYEFASKQKRTIAKVASSDSPGIGKGAVSPDGKLIAYGQVPDVRIVSFDGSNDRLLVPGPYNQGCCPWSYGHPIFSADSATVLYSTIGTMLSIHVDGTAQTQLEQDDFFPNVMIPGFVFPEPSFSPDYSKLVAQIACDVSELRIFDSGELPGDPCTAGTKLVEVGLSEAYNEASNATWGPTNLIAYDLMKDVFVIDPSGGTPTNLTALYTTEDSAYASDPVWASGCTEIP